MATETLGACVGFSFSSPFKPSSISKILSRDRGEINPSPRFSLPLLRALIPAWRLCTSNRFNLSTRRRHAGLPAGRLKNLKK
jgi:hypothetical protein